MGIYNIVRYNSYHFVGIYAVYKDVIIVISEVFALTVRVFEYQMHIILELNAFDSIEYFRKYFSLLVFSVVYN